MTVQDGIPQAQVAPRDPALVMRLARLGAMHPSRLSFMRILTRRMAAESWRISRHLWQVDDRGVGRAVYLAQTPDRTYALVAFAHDLPDEMRSDRVIATAWDATFALHDGVPGPEDLDRLEANVPLQEAGRVSEAELTLSRANRSSRLWDHVVSALAAGQQPDPAQLEATGYLMRTTAVYGSGKFGAADREVIADRPEMTEPFQAEMLTVYLIRAFARDLVEHMAVARGGDGAVMLDDRLARNLGIGNATGLGMAPFLINHPVLLNNWIEARETAIARVRSLPRATVTERGLFATCLAAARRSAEVWRTSDAQQAQAVDGLRRDLGYLEDWCALGGLDSPMPWDQLMRHAAETLDLEAQEAAASLILEPYPQLVDDLAQGMSDNRSADALFDASQTVGEVLPLLTGPFGWAETVDWTAPEAQARVWYVSAEKLEPRLGEAASEPVADYALPLAPAREAAKAIDHLRGKPVDMPLWQVLAEAPALRGALVRAQLCARAPYGELRDNTLAQDMRPIDMLRAKLSFFGATRFDPRSDRWLRICMYAGAPYPADLTPATADRWGLPGGAA